MLQGTGADRLHDLGVLTGDLLAFGGPYSNLQATRALFGRAATLGIATENLICTGDTVAYGADPQSTVDLVRTSGARLIAGNCEVQLASGAQDFGCGFDRGNACSLLSVAWYGYAKALIGAEARAWMGGLPLWLCFAHAGRRVAVIHGGATAINRFVWQSDEAEVFRAEHAALVAALGPIDRVIAGHSGIAFQRDFGDFDWINAGAIGLPPHDGRTETGFAVISSDGGVAFERLDYDHQAAAGAMVAAGLTQGYDRALLSGYWPSEDSLPTAQRLGRTG